MTTRSESISKHAARSANDDKTSKQQQDQQMTTRSANVDKISQY
jgi:hypothetical protein